MEFPFETLCTWLLLWNSLYLTVTLELSYLIVPLELSYLIVPLKLSYLIVPLELSYLIVPFVPIWRFVSVPPQELVSLSSIGDNWRSSSNSSCGACTLTFRQRSFGSCRLIIRHWKVVIQKQNLGPVHELLDTQIVVIH